MTRRTSWTPPDHFAPAIAILLAPIIIGVAGFTGIIWMVVNR